MTKHIYRGEWVTNVGYFKDQAVKFGDIYYIANKPNANKQPNISPSDWRKANGDTSVSTEPIKASYDALNALGRDINDMLDDNGLYMFPSKKSLSTGNVLTWDGYTLFAYSESLDVPEAYDNHHFHKMGIKMMYDIARTYYNENKDSMPNITGIYIMQGDRKINVVTQGFSVAAVEAVGFSINAPVHVIAGDYKADLLLSQTTKLGTSSEDVAFPIIGGNDYRLFPIIKISRGRIFDNGGYKKYIFRMEEDSISEVLVSEKNDRTEYEFVHKEGTDVPLNRLNAVYESSLGFNSFSPSMLSVSQKEIYNNIKTNKFCIYTPDILIDKGISISSNLFIKSIKKVGFDISYNGILSNMNGVSKSYDNKYASLFSNGKYDDGNKLTTYHNSIYDEDTDMRYFEYSKTSYRDTNNQVFSSQSTIINSNIINGVYGFSTRMKSIIEVFGFDYKTGVEDSLSSTIESFVSASRNELFASGVIVNRYRWDHNDDISGDIKVGEDQEFKNEANQYRYYPFGYRLGKALVYPQGTDSGHSTSIPQIFTNLSMQSLPYVGVKLPARHKYSSMASLNTGEPSYQDLHNAIVNLCIYEDNKTYKEAIRNEFNMLSETYKVIEYTDTWNVEGENLVLNSDKYKSSSNYWITWYEMSEKWVTGETYTVAIKGKLNPGQRFGLYRGWGNGEGKIIEDKGELLHILTFECPAKAPSDDSNDKIVSIFSIDEPNAKHGYIEWIKIEKGDTFTGYSKAPQDEILLRGDIFSQKTFMRVIRWSDLPDVMTTPKEGWDWSYSWKYGQAINVYLQSRVNTYLRSVTHDSTYINDALRDYDNREDAIANFIWKNTSMRYMNESWRTNEGYNVTHGLLQLQPFNETVMKRTYEASNRIYVSNAHVGGAIADAYREIPAGQYRDYNFDGGEIVALAKFNNMLFSIQRSAMLQHYTSKKLTQSEDSSTIITGNKEVLSDQFRELAAYGSQHRDSIVEGMMGIYGIDWNREKIWRITQKHGEQGGVFYVAEDLATSKQAYDIFKLIKTDDKPLDETVYDKGGIVSAYDEQNKLVLFTFHYLKNGVKKYQTLGFSEEIDAFIGFYDYSNNIYMKLDGRLFGYSAAEKKQDVNDLWEHNTHDEYLNIYDSHKPLELEFIVNCASEQQNASQFEKEFMSHLISSSHLKFNVIDWETEWQDSSLSFNTTDFWNEPEYREHTWRVPIVYNTNTYPDGPLGPEVFKAFENDSAIRGQWLKVKLKYVPLNGQEYIQFYIKNVITNFIISYS